MTYYYFIFKSLTQTQRAVALLRRGGISADMVRTPPSEVNSGCAFAVRVRLSAVDLASALLYKTGLRPLRTERDGYTREEVGRP